MKLVIFQQQKNSKIFENMKKKRYEITLENEGKHIE